MLLYRDGNFMQVLEGERQAVDAAYAAIADDVRHTGMLRLLGEECSTRQFANWSMAFHRMESLPTELAAGFSEFLTESFVAPVITARPQRAWQLLLGFRDAMR